jgi:oxygen-independent coproporphyrinogen-3 oxidase
LNQPQIERLISDGAVTLRGNRLAVTEGAEFLVRSVASAFDAYLSPSTTSYSRAI